MAPAMPPPKLGADRGSAAVAWLQDFWMNWTLERESIASLGEQILDSALGWSQAVKLAQANIEPKSLVITLLQPQLQENEELTLL